LPRRCGNWKWEGEEPWQGVDGQRAVRLCALDLGPGHRSTATGGPAHFMICALLGTYVLFQEKLRELLKSRQAHSMRFRNRSVKRIIAVLLN